MKKKVIAVLLMVSMVAAMLAGCGASSGSSEETAESESAEGGADERTVRLAFEPSTSHVLNIVAEAQGYLEEEGVTVEYVPCSTYEDAFTGLAGGKIDVLSNYGTNLPLQYIGSGTDLTIFGGYMITGCMPIIAKAGTEWNGVEDMIGTKVAGLLNNFAVTGALLDLGYDPETEIEWVELADYSERVAAVKSGEADYAILATGFTYQVQNDPSLEVVAFCSDIMPDYSCCRVEANTDWVNDNQELVKDLLKAWIRAQNWYEENKEETAKLVAEDIDVSEEYTAAYVTNDHLKLSVDPYLSSVERAWNYLGELGSLQDGWEDIDISSHVNVDLYKQALDECVEEHYDEAPEFYDRQLEIFEEVDQ